MGTTKGIPAVRIVSFVNGPSLNFPSCDDLRALSLLEYIERGRRLVEHLHPLADRIVETLMAPGSEWPEGAEPPNE